MRGFAKELRNLLRPVHPYLTRYLQIREKCPEHKESYIESCVSGHKARRIILWIRRSNKTALRWTISQRLLVSPKITVVHPAKTLQRDWRNLLRHNPGRSVLHPF